MNANIETSALFDDVACLEKAMGPSKGPATLVYANCDCSGYYPSYPLEENEASDSLSLPQPAV
ncbi:hypothetical protein [Siphonobacter sp. SORGH_AS_1065]|uniref:hypothetical protein n=1 Tax=Siphonobacter sp. SORGH_AS_1065 TaxID=3041795 RepID=UPI002783AD6F|nr:hypothetical protein [Siphonobacter sp. SORGH_AS_1065]MDQ1086152.1 hypothetical protein [Siphonobacter sp. SORGH_AS_1065]